MKGNDTLATRSLHAKVVPLFAWLREGFGKLFPARSTGPFVAISVAMLIAFALAVMGQTNIGAAFGGATSAPSAHQNSSFQWGVLAIFVAMELFTGLVVGTGLMEVVAVGLIRISRGHKLILVVFFGFMLFFVSSFLNNLTAMLVILPVLFVALRQADLEQRFVTQTFALLLAVSNLGGAATPIGDFPAIIIMKSGLTDFTGYLTKAFPLFISTTVVMIGLHALLFMKRGDGPKNETSEAALRRRLGVRFLSMQYRHVRIKSLRALLLGLAFAATFCGWAFLPASGFPPEVVAFAGLSLAVLLVAPLGASAKFRNCDLGSVLTIAAFLFLGAVVANTGILHHLAHVLEDRISNPKHLLIAVMIATAAFSGLMQAGPATAAMLPVIQSLAAGPFADQSQWLAIAFASSICAGSSAFVWSATAGFLLRDKVNNADLSSKSGEKIGWGIAQYLPFGVLHMLVQLSVAIAWILLALKLS